MEISNLLISLFVILVTAKIFGEIAERFGHSAVIGELIGGVLIGGSVLGLIRENEVLHHLAEIGAILLLFEIGVSSNLYEFLKVGFWAFVVACIGVICPFILGYFVSIGFGLDHVHAIFVGAILTATSVGVTARVFSDLKKITSQEAQIVLGAAVIDDIIGLAILAVVTKLVSTGTISVLNIVNITGLALLFLVGSLFIGAIFAPFLFNILKTMQVRGILIVGAFSFCLLLAYFSTLAGLAPIVGAFSAGLVLSITDSKTHIEEKLKPISDIFVPIFFVLMGSLVDIKIFNPTLPQNQIILGIAGALLLAAVLGKIISGFFVFKKKINKLVIGVGMIPRGEVGLIFASMGLTMHIIDPSLYSAAVVVIIITTFITPFMLKILLRKE